jgi:protein arginine kinase
MMAGERILRVPGWFSGQGDDSDVVVSTRVRLARNLARRCFPSRASLLEKKTVFEEVVGAAEAVTLCSPFEKVNFAHISRLEQQYLVENRAASHDLLGIEGDRGVISDASWCMSVMINEEDHLRLQCMAPGCNTSDTWEHIDALDNAFGEELLYAFDHQKGFLTSCPTNSGTGLRVSFLVHLPGLALTKTIDQVLQGASQMGVSTRGFFGENSEIIGNLFQLSNQATMGAGEKEFLESTHSIIMRIVDIERAARDRILKQAKNELNDKVFRAYGLMLYARTLTMKELLNLSSALRMGMECGLFDTYSIGRLNKLVIAALPAHLQLHFGTSMTEDELNAKRAEIVRNALRECAVQ